MNIVKVEKIIPLCPYAKWTQCVWKQHCVHTHTRARVRDRVFPVSRSRGVGSFLWVISPKACWLLDNGETS